MMKHVFGCYCGEGMSVDPRCEELQKCTTDNQSPPIIKELRRQLLELHAMSYSVRVMDQLQFIKETVKIIEHKLNNIITELS